MSLLSSSPATHPQRIAIIGTGISGLTAAHLLHKQHDVTVYEANDYIGGHTHTVPVALDGQSFEVDTGFIVCNDRNYPNFLELMSRLPVTLQPTEMSFSVRNTVQNLEYNGHTLNTLFSQRRNLLRPAFYRLVTDILRFNRIARAAVDDAATQTMTLNAFVDQHGFGTDFRANYLLPMVAAIWSCSTQQAGAFPLDFFLRFFLNHGLLDIRNRPQWYVLKGGSHSYIPSLTAGYSDRIQLQTPVRAVTRTASEIRVQLDGRTESFDQVILACHSDQALALLQNPEPDETTVLGAIGYQENTVTLHTDPSLMPVRPRSWASWNFLAGTTGEEALPIVTYSMNILQGLVSSQPLLVSLNASNRIHQDRILQEFRYAHPVYSAAALQAQARRDLICGKDRIHFCGAYWYNGFHEDGVRSALDVCARFGASL